MESKSGPINYSKFNNEEYDGLMAEAEAVSDLDQRATILREAEEVAMEGQPVAPIYYYVSKQLVSPTVVGWVDNVRSAAHTSELQSLMRTSYAVTCLTKNRCCDHADALRRDQRSRTR